MEHRLESRKQMCFMEANELEGVFLTFAKLESVIHNCLCNSKIRIKYLHSKAQYASWPSAKNNSGSFFPLLSIYLKMLWKSGGKCIQMNARN